MSNRDIISQDQSYRRGLVLGLTVAEIMLLLLFILLLVLSTSLARMERKVAEGDRLLQSASAIPGMKNHSSASTEKPSKDSGEVTFTDVINYVQEAAKAAEDQRNQEGQNTVILDILRELRKAGFDHLPPNEIVTRLGESERLRAAVSGFGYKTDDVVGVLDQLRDANNDLSKQNDNLQGQNAQLSRQIKTEGRGNEFPGCWVTKDGKAESIFKIIYSDTGISVHNLAVPHRAKDQEKLPLAGVIYDQPLSVIEFADQFGPIRDWSVKNNCRFHAQRYTTDVRTRVDLQNAVDLYFYPGTPLKTISASQ